MLATTMNAASDHKLVSSYAMLTASLAATMLGWYDICYASCISHRAVPQYPCSPPCRLTQQPAAIPATAPATSLQITLAAGWLPVPE
jgi:hypothetical protein